ncbi:MAG: thiamine ABC transporter substrate-binding protein [Ilumatobacteraceae bacterium]|nr:thiamine ABC transporter substrate-binding protein [Ilumatobacteraceae bacterium]
MKRPLLLAATAALAIGACSSDEPDSLRLLTYESFPDDPEGPIAIALDEFTEETGIEVEVVIAGDTGTMVSAAALTAGNPEADVIWGIDNTFLSRAIEADVFEPYEAEGLDAIPSDLTDLVPDHHATPVDFGDVCLNYDIGALDRLDLAPPTSFADLLLPEYEGKLVVENPGTSSPGLAFLLATIATYGEDGWEEYWRGLRANDVKVANGWSEAYYGDFTRAGGDRPLVVSYGSSPPFEVLYAEEPLDEAASGVVESTCFRQVEFAGILRGTDAPENAGKLIDFLISERFQREIALNLFVFPANDDVELETEFELYAAIPDSSITIDPSLIDANRTDWIERWNAAVLR